MQMTLLCLTVSLDRTRARISTRLSKESLYTEAELEERADLCRSDGGAVRGPALAGDHHYSTRVPPAYNCARAGAHRARVRGRAEPA